MDQKMIFESPQTCASPRFPRVFAVAMVALLAIVSAGCGQAGRESPSPTVVATTTIVADLVRQIAADQVQVVSLMGAGVDPHSYRPTPRDADRLARADLIVASGLHLEGKLAELLGRISERKQVVFVAEAIPEASRLEAAAGIPDPHVWFDLSLWAASIDPTLEALCKLRPDAADVFRQAADRYRASLLATHADVQSAIAAIDQQQRVLVTAHDAFRYFGRAYAIEVVGVQGVSTESEAGLADINRLVDLLVQRQVPAVFVETSVPDRSVRAICEGAAAKGHAVTTGGRLYSDALGEPGSGAETLELAIRANVQVICEALQADRATENASETATTADGGSSESP
jgi:manganese/zinc/iron transport system substrate-binding protein